MALFKANDDVDWTAVEREYRAGVLSNQAIAAEYGVTEGAIRKRAKKGGWVRAEGQLVRARAKQIAAERTVPKYQEPTTDKLEALAQVGADVLVRHQRSTATLQGVLQKLVGQLTDQSDNEGDLAGAIEEYYMQKAKQNPLAAAAYRQQCNHALHAIGLGARSKTLLNLVSAADKLVAMERRAWNLDEEGDKRTYEDLLAEIHAKTAKAA